MDLIKVPKNPLASKKKWNKATEGKLKLYPRYVNRRGNSCFFPFDPDSEAAYSVEQAFEEWLREELDDLRDDYMNEYWDREY